MTNEEIDSLVKERELLKQLLDFYVSNPKLWLGNQKEFQKYVDAALDRLNEINKRLDEIHPK